MDFYREAEHDPLNSSVPIMESKEIREKVITDPTASDTGKISDGI